MRFKIIALLLCCGLCNWAQAQAPLAEGVVFDTQTHQPIPFATLGIKGKNIGSIANDNGNFHFSLDGAAPDEQVVISSVGYTATSIRVSKFKQGKQEINLTPSSKELNAVTIKPQKYETKVFGRTANSTMMTANMFTQRNLVADNLGNEQAAILSIDKHCVLRDFNMLVIFNHFQSVKFRLNFYSVKDGRPDELIVDKDILFDVTQQKGWQKVYLTAYNITLEGYKEIAVAIQWVKSVKTETENNPTFGVSVSPVLFHSIFFRNKSQAEWKKISTANAAFYITADTFNPEK